MVVRLAFAVIANTEPKILIVDEALSVGDARFQARCMKRIRQLKDQGVTILFVSHDSGSVKMLCKSAVLMNHGRILEIGDPKDVVNHYIALLSSETTEVDVEEISSIENHDDFVNSNQDNSLHRHGNKLAIIKKVKLCDLDEKEITKVETGANFQIGVLVEAQAELSELVVGISIRNLMGLVIYGTNSLIMDIKLPELQGGEQLKVFFKVPCYLNKGVYTVTVGIHSEEGLSYDWIDELVVFEVHNSIFCDGIVDLKSSINISKPKYYVLPQQREKI
jgi:lipopolysaccharide transport system ATP-binding protein